MSAGFIGELRVWAGQMPYNEELHAALARGLQGVGRSAEALDVLRLFRNRMRDELGMDAGSSVAHEELAILRAERAAPAPAPREATVGELQQLIHLAMAQLTPADQPVGSSPDGRPGTDMTAGPHRGR